MKAEFVSPDASIFDLPPVFTVAGFEVNKPMLIAVVGSVLVAALFIAASRKATIVPGRYQYFWESVYSYVRNDITLELIGKQGLRFVPFLATMFTFIAMMNLAGMMPFIHYPATSHIGFSLAVALCAWLLYNWQGMKKQGYFGYFKAMLVPPGVPKAICVVLGPIEFFSMVIARPITLTLRLTLNMFAGHLIVVLFILGGNYLFFNLGGVVGVATGALASAAGIGMMLFEVFIQLLQAYLFTLLTALYIGGALAEEH